MVYPNPVERLEPRVLLAADLAVSFASRLPSALSPTAINRITLRLVNHGDATAVGLATLQLYASMTPSLDSAFLLGTAAPKLNLKVGNAIKPVISFKSPTNLPTSAYYLVAAVIPGFVEDGFSNDQIASSPVRIVQPFVDLTDSVVITPAAPKYTVGGKSQKPIKFTLTIHNGGNISARGSAAVDLFGSADALDDFDLLLQSFGVKRLNLNAGKSVKFTISWKPTAATQSGTFFGDFRINANKGVTETDATNDVAVTASELTITNPGRPIMPTLTAP